MNYSKIAVLIPTFNPDENLVKLVEILQKEGFSNIIVVNDGSVDDRALYKIKVKKVLGHSFNRGKGYSLKEGFKYIYETDTLGVIIVDDDLQHDVFDIKNMCNLFLKEEGIYFGVRSFEGAPLIRRKANIFTANLFNKLYDFNLRDTQCGLRLYPRWILPKLMNISGDGFEYEMNQIKFLALNRYDIFQVPIKTIYNGKSSHFNGLKDSYKIIKNLFNKNV